MASRMSRNKRLSRYSKNSTASAILDPDTEILGDENSYWWNHLENDTIPRPSTSNIVNETSPHLNATSVIETSHARDNWWKILETSKTSNYKFGTENRRKDKVDNVKSTSESEEESRIMKKKVTVLSQQRKGGSSAFLNALNDSSPSVASLPVKNARSSSLPRDSASRGRGSLKHRESEVTAETSGNQSQSIDDVKKQKPKIFTKRPGDQDKNVFDDVLKDTVQSPLKKKSLRLPSFGGSQILSQPEGIAEPSLSFESENEFSRCPVPKAQSTIIDNSIGTSRNSNKASDISNAETEIMKPKAMFRTNQRKSRTENLFENVLKNKTNSMAKKTSESSDASTVKDSPVLNKSQGAPTAGSLKNSRLESNETGDKVRSSNIERNVSDTLPEKNARVSVENDIMDDVSIVTSDSSNMSLVIPKKKSIFLTKPSKLSHGNVFVDILNEKENVGTLEGSRNRILSDPSNFQAIPKSPASDVIASTSTTSDSTPRSPSKSSFNESDANKVEDMPRKQTKDSNRSENFRVASNSELNKIRKSWNRPASSSSGDSDELDDGESSQRKRNANLNTSERQSTAAVPEVPNRSRNDDRQIPPKRDSSSVGKTKESLNDHRSNVFAPPEDPSTLRSSNLQNSARRESANLNGSSKKSRTPDSSDSKIYTSVKKVLEQISSKPRKFSFIPMDIESEMEGVMPEEGEGRKHLNSSHRKSTADVSEKIPGVEIAAGKNARDESTVRRRSMDSEKIVNVAGKPQSVKSPSEKSEQFVLRVATDSESEGLPKEPTRKGETLNRSDRRRISYNENEPEGGELGGKSARKNAELNISRKRSIIRVESESDEGEEFQIIPITRSKTRSGLHIESGFEWEELPSKSTRKSRELEISRRRSISIMESESEEKERNISGGKSRRLIRFQEQISSPVGNESEAKELKNKSSGKSRTSNTTEKHLSLRIENESESEEVPRKSMRKSGELEISKRHLISSMESESEEKERNKSGGKSRMLIRFQEQISSPVGNESEANELKNKSSGKSRTSNRSEKHLSLGIENESEAEELKNKSSRKSRTLNRSKDGISLPIENEPEGLPNKSTRKSGELKISKKRSIFESESSEEEPSMNRLSKKRRTSNSSERQINLPIDNEPEAEELPRRSTRKSKNVNISEKSIMSRNENEHEAEELPRKSTRKSKSVNIFESESSEEEPLTNTLSKNRRTSNSSERQTNLPIDNEPEAEELPRRSTRKSKNVNISEKSIMSRNENEPEAEELPRKSTRKSKSVNIFESESSEEEPLTNTLSKNRRTSNSLERQINLPIDNEPEAEELPRRSTRKSKNVNISEKSIMSRNENEPEAEELPRKSTRKSKSVNISEKQVFSRSESEPEAEELPRKSTRKSKNVNISEKQIFSRSESEPEAEELPNTSARKSKELRKSEKQLTVPIGNKSTPDERANTLPRKSRELNISRKQFISMTENDSEAEELPNTSSRKSKELRKSEKQLTVPIEKKSTPDERANTLPGKSRELNISRKQFISMTENDSEAEELPNISSRKSKELRKSEKQLTVPIENKSTLDERANTLPGKSRELNISRKQFISMIENDSEAEELPNTSPRKSRVLNKSEQLTIPTRNESPSKVDRHKEHLSNEQKKRVSSPPKEPTSHKSSKLPRIIELKRLKTVVSINRSGELPKNQKKMHDFFKTGNAVPAAQFFADPNKVEAFRKKLELMKEKELAALKTSQKKTVLNPGPVKHKGLAFGETNSTPRRRPRKPVHEAYLVNGKVYKPPRLVRPKRWVTDHLYRYLWKYLEPKYGMESRVVSEKFVQQLSEVTAFIVKAKTYDAYKNDLLRLMKEMARLGIIRTRREFYKFTFDFLPYEIRFKTTPMLLPGNGENIPYDPSKLDVPLLESEP